MLPPAVIKVWKNPYSLHYTSKMALHVGKSGGKYDTHHANGVHGGNERHYYFCKYFIKSEARHTVLLERLNTSFSMIWVDGCGQPERANSAVIGGFRDSASGLRFSGLRFGYSGQGDI